MRLAELAGAAIAFAAIKRLTDAKPTAVTPTKPLIQQGFTLGPAAPSMDIKPLIPEGAFKITLPEIAAFDPDRKVTIPTFDPALPVAKPITQGKIKKLGTGVSLADLLKRQTPRK
tara:strand:- start:1039 stop:1383 length:345 start_codon:yes stop_codon:yes gene_type:complete